MPDDLALERLGLALAGVREDPVAHLVRQVQLLGDPQRLLVVAEAGAEALAQARVERLLAGVPERRVAHVVAEPDRLGQILVQPQRAGDDAGDPGRLERVRHARAVVVAGRVDEDLRLALQPPERLRVDDPVAVALERRPDAALRPPRGARPRVSYERTASGDSSALSCARMRASKASATRPASSGMSSGYPARRISQLSSAVAAQLWRNRCRRLTRGHVLSRPVRGQSPTGLERGQWRLPTRTRIGASRFRG